MEKHIGDMTVADLERLSKKELDGILTEIGIKIDNCLANEGMCSKDESWHAKAMTDHWINMKRACRIRLQILALL